MREKNALGLSIGHGWVLTLLFNICNAAAVAIDSWNDVPCEEIIHSLHIKKYCHVQKSLNVPMFLFFYVRFSVSAKFASTFISYSLNLPTRSAGQAECCPSHLHFNVSVLVTC